MMVFPFIILVFLTILYFKMRGIYAQLVNIVEIPYDIRFTKFDVDRNPLMNIDKMPNPRYLQDKPQGY